MNHKREISLDERKKIQLDMLQEVHDFCVANNIRYSLAFGTLLGAIRHKGYIPWDDDVDIMMPLPDMLRFKKEFKSDTVKYSDIDNEDYYEFPFSRLSYKPTYSTFGLIGKTYGVSIDLYPVVSIPSEIEQQSLFFKRAINLQNHRLFFTRWRTRIVDRLPISTIPGYSNSVKRFRDHLLFNSLSYGTTGDYYIIAIPIERREKVIYHLDLFSGMMILPFEDRFFQVTVYFKEFLCHMYGDYMQLPPENERQPYHGGNFFWK